MASHPSEARREPEEREVPVRALGIPSWKDDSPDWGKRKREGSWGHRTGVFHCSVGCSLVRWVVRESGVMHSTVAGLPVDVLLTFQGGGPGTHLILVSLRAPDCL